MKISLSSLFSATALIGALFATTVSAHADKEPVKKPAPAKSVPAENEPGGNDLLRIAVTAMSGLTSYHAAGTFSAGGKKATISGEFAVGAVDMQVLGFDGKIVFRRALKDKYWISHDSGKTWQEDTAKEMTTLLSLAVTSPMNADRKIWEQGAFAVVGGEKLGDEEVLHLQRIAREKEPAMDFWLAKDAKLGLIIRRASFVITAGDGDFPVVMAYSNFNEPVKITAPAAAPKPEVKEKHL